MNPGPCFYPLKSVREDGGDDGDGGDFRARDVTVEGYCGEGVGVKGAPAVDSARGRDRSEGVHFFAWGAQVEIRSPD